MMSGRVARRGPDISKKEYEKKDEAGKLYADQADAARATRCTYCGARPYGWCIVRTKGYGVARYLHKPRMQLWRSTQPRWRGGALPNYQVRPLYSAASAGTHGVWDTTTCTWVHVDGESVMTEETARRTAERCEREDQANA
jgi:hypothetical protein